jgi:hypothetical protein
MTEFLVGCHTFGAGGRGRRIEVVAHDPDTLRWELLTDRDVTEPIAGESSCPAPGNIRGTSPWNVPTWFDTPGPTRVLPMPDTHTLGN